MISFLFYIVYDITISCAPLLRHCQYSARRSCDVIVPTYFNTFYVESTFWSVLDFGENDLFFTEEP
jgi:hypothetical protein